MEMKTNKTLLFMYEAYNNYDGSCENIHDIIIWTLLSNSGTTSGINEVHVDVPD